MVSYKLVRDNSGAKPDTVTAYFEDRDAPIKVADANHPHYAEILQLLADNDDSAYDLFDVRQGVTNKLNKLSDRVSYDGVSILFDGDPVHDVLAQQMVRFLEEGKNDYKPLVAFLEKVAQNPEQHSRENLYRWLAAAQFTLTADGDIVGYKGVQSVNGELASTRTGTAFVDGKKVVGHIPNPVGAEITMPRSEVNHNPSEGCSTGLHIGTYDFAKSFGTVTLEVHVNPRDVVSVPTDASDRKMRVCRYVVVGQIAEKYETPVLNTPALDSVNDDDDWDDDDDYDEQYGLDYDDDLDEDYDDPGYRGY